jgi:hypothetical protein
MIGDRARMYEKAEEWEEEKEREGKERGQGK